MLVARQRQRTVSNLIQHYRDQILLEATEANFKGDVGERSADVDPNSGYMERCHAPALTSSLCGQYRDGALRKRVADGESRQRTSDGRFGSNFHCGIKNCMAIESSRAPRPILL